MTDRDLEKKSVEDLCEFLESKGFGEDVTDKFIGSLRVG